MPTTTTDLQAEKLNLIAWLARCDDAGVIERVAEVARGAEAGAGSRHAGALAEPTDRAGWDAVADGAAEDVAAGRVYADDEVGEYLRGVAGATAPGAGAGRVGCGTRCGRGGASGRSSGTTSNSVARG